ncbi:hypothetical protein ACFE04_025028 [Oxalis oulophora]
MEEKNSSSECDEANTTKNQLVVVVANGMEQDNNTSTTSTSCATPPPSHCNNDNSNEIEQSKVGIMRALVEREDPSSKEEDDFMIRRFLRARDLDIEKASTMFLKYLSWKREFLPNGHVTAAEIQDQLSHKKLFMQGFDKTGRLIVVAFGARHKPCKGNLDEFKRNSQFQLSNYINSSILFIVILFNNFSDLQAL